MKDYTKYTSYVLVNMQFEALFKRDIDEGSIDLLRNELSYRTSRNRLITTFNNDVMALTSLNMLNITAGRRRYHGSSMSWRASM